MALTRFQIKVYAELGEKERISFVTTRKTRQFDLGGTILARRFIESDGTTSNTRIQIIRTDQFNKDGSNRVIYRRIGFRRFVNMDEERLNQDLGYDIDQVIAYINQQANLEEIDGFTVCLKGTVVSSAATTLDFEGTAVQDLIVSSGIATITIAQTTGGGSGSVGIATAGGYVGTGITLFDFRGAGVSTVTAPVSGISTIHFDGGDGNPVISGIVTDGNNTLTITLQDNTTVDVDVSGLNQCSPISIAQSSSFFYRDNGSQLSNNNQDIDGAGVVFYGTPLRRGEEVTFNINSTSDVHVGTFTGGNGIRGNDNVNATSNWGVKWYYDVDVSRWNPNSTVDHSVESGTGTNLTKSFHINRNNTFAIRYGYDSEKLELWQVGESHDFKISTANVGVGTTQVYVYVSAGSTTHVLPTFGEVRSADWKRISYWRTPYGVSLEDGMTDGEVWQSQRSLSPGMKMTTTDINSNQLGQVWAHNWLGNGDLGNGPGNPENSSAGSWRIHTGEQILAENTSTLNSKYVGINTALTSQTLSLKGRTVSWRYNTDNTWDVFDEDLDQVIVSGSYTLDGNPFTPYFIPLQSSSNPTQWLHWDWDWNAATWFMDHRDWSPGRTLISGLRELSSAKPLSEAADVFSSSNGFTFLSDHNYRATWGEKMRPGQELKFTMLSQTSDNASSNMIIGVLDSTFSSYNHGFRFWSNGALKAQSDQDAGVTVQAGITTTCAGASMRLKYDYGDNKLKLDAVRSGVRETLAVSDSALDGNPIYISLGGNSTRLPTTSGVEVYGWEVAHEPPNYYNPWNQWRIGGFPENQTSIAGIHSTSASTVLDWAGDQVWRHKDGLAPGYKMHWISPTSQTNSQVGVFSSSNPTSGLTNLENESDYWDWSWQTNTSEEIDALKGWTFNTSNSNYSGVSTSWTDSDPGNTRVSLRYHSNNTMDLYDETNGEVIISKTAPNDGNPVYISWVAGGNTVSYDQMNDDFFGGGDVGIALTTATV